MARQLTIFNNFIAPSGYVILTNPQVINGKLYSKIWASFWDIIINKGLEDIPQEEKKEHKNWTWYGIHNNKVMVSVKGDEIKNFIETSVKPIDINVYIVGGRKKNAKIPKKASSS